MQNKDISLNTGTIKVFHAGSLTALVRQRLAPAWQRTHGVKIESESGHSVELASAVKEGRLQGDVYMSADAEVNQTLLGVENGDWIHWFVTFARNAVVLAYSPHSRFLADFAQVRQGTIPWYQPLLQSGVKISRNDPNLDPMGYYTLLVCTLAQQHTAIPDLKQRLLGSDTNPEQVNRGNFTQFESGEIDAMFLYRSAAVEYYLPYLPLPDEINLSTPALAATYSQVQFTTDRGQTFHGKPISFSAAVLKNARDPELALDFVAFLLSPDGQQLVQSAHFLPGQALAGGDTTSVPHRLQSLIQGSYQLL